MGFSVLRDKCGYKTQEQLSNATGIKRSTISMWECGKAKPDIITAQKLAKIMQVGIEDVINCFNFKR